MSRSVRKAVAAAAVFCSVLTAQPASAQDGKPFSEPRLRDRFPGNGAQATPTPTTTRTPDPSPSPSPSPSPTATATPKPGRGTDDLPNTGSDPLRVGLMGLTLLGFGISLRLRVLDARRDD